MTISNYFRRSKFFIVMVVGATLSACGVFETPREEIPRDAFREGDFINGNVWYWSDKLESGCTYWMASERWVSVQIVTNSECSADSRHDRVRGKRVSYVDYSPQLYFKEYGPWSSNIRDGVNVFDGQGNYLGDRPCPHEITLQDISKMTSLAKEAAAVSTTEGERKIMKRIATRLENIDLSALFTEQFGCTDVPSYGRSVQIIHAD